MPKEEDKGKLTNKEELENSIIAFLDEFINNNEGLVFVTEDIAFDMKNLIRQNRKNYWGIFNEPVDPVTGRKKIWSPLTRFVVDTTDKNTHIAEKEIIFRAKNPEKQNLTRIVRGYGQNQMRKMDFGTKMSVLRKQKFIDGTSVVRITKAEKNNDGITVHMKRVDRLNIYIDATVDSIKEAPAFAERDLMTPYEVESQKDWMNTDDIQGEQNLSRNDVNSIGDTGSKQKLVEVFRFEGLAPKYFLTGNMDDDEEMEQVNQRIIVSGLTKGTPRVHVVEKLENDKKTYVENWAEKIPGRWDGFSPAERVSMMQYYQNKVLNTRMIKNDIASLGLFKVRKGSGITPQQISRLSGNGVIKVDRMDDIEQWQMSEAGSGSYNDEEVATKWAQRDTNAYDAATGEQGIKTTATEAAITARSAGSSFEQVAEEEANFWERVFNDHILPIWGKCIKKGDIIRLTLDGEELRQFDLELANTAMTKYLEDSGKQGLQFIDIQEIEAIKQKALDDLEKGNTDRYETALEDINLTDYDVEVVVKTQRFDRNLVAQSLLSLGQMDPRLMEQVIPQLNDLWDTNLKMPKAVAQEPGQQMQGGEQQAPAGIQEQLTSALTQQGQGVA